MTSSYFNGSRTLFVGHEEDIPCVEDFDEDWTLVQRKTDKEGEEKGTDSEMRLDSSEVLLLYPQDEYGLTHEKTLSLIGVLGPCNKINAEGDMPRDFSWDLSRPANIGLKGNNNKFGGWKPKPDKRRISGPLKSISSTSSLNSSLESSECPSVQQISDVETECLQTQHSDANLTQTLEIDFEPNSENDILERPISHDKRALSDDEALFENEGNPLMCPSPKASLLTDVSQTEGLCQNEKSDAAELSHRHKRKRRRLFTPETKSSLSASSEPRRRTGIYAWVILVPADHPYKNAWDVLTVILTFLSAYATHMSIRDRSYDYSPFVIFTEVWFLIDVLLNFVTEHKSSNGQVIRDVESIWGRYLTTWFAVDILSLIPWERIYVKPIVDMQKRRGFFKKYFFRTRAVVRVTRVLRGRHFRLFGKVAGHTKRAGVGGKRLLAVIIRYLPKYLMFYRNMRGVLAVRTLRLIHFVRRVFKNMLIKVKGTRSTILEKRMPDEKNYLDAFDSDDDPTEGNSVSEGSENMEGHDTKEVRHHEVFDVYFSDSEDEDDTVHPLSRSTSDGLRLRRQMPQYQKRRIQINFDDDDDFDF